MKLLIYCRIAIALLSAWLGLMPQCLGQQPMGGDPMQEFEATLTKLASSSPDDCGWGEPSPKAFSGDTAKLEDDLFDHADAATVQAMNAPGMDPRAAIAQALESMRAISTRVNGVWPSDRRFHYELLEINPVFIVTYHVRGRSTWSAFGVSAEAASPNKGKNTRWAQVGEDEFRWQPVDSDQEMEVHPLMRGPSRRARFLAKSSRISCGDGTTGLDYSAYEWSPAYRKLRTVD